MNIKLTANVGGHPYNLDQTVINEAGELTPIAVGLLTRGFQKVLTDAHSTATRGTGDDKVKASPQERIEDVLKRLEKLKDGTYTFGGGGGKVTTPANKAMKHALQKYGVKFSKGMDIETGLVSLAEAIAKQNDKEFALGMVDSIRQQLEASEIYQTKLAAEQAAISTLPSAAQLTL